MRAWLLALSLTMGLLALSIVAAAATDDNTLTPSPLSPDELKPYLQVFLTFMGQDLPEDAEYSRLTRLGVGAIFVEALGKRSLTEDRLTKDEELRRATTVLTLEFGRLLIQRGAVPPSPLHYRSEKQATADVERMRLNYSRLARTWYGLGPYAEAGYPHEFFALLYEAGVGTSYPAPHSKLSRHDYAARILHTLLLKADTELMRKWGPAIIAASLDLAAEMMEVGGGKSTMYKLRQLYEDSLSEQEVNEAENES